MKNRKFRLLMLFGLAVFTICILFASCEMFTPPDTGKTPKDISRSSSDSKFNRREELALLHLTESNVSSQEEMQNMILEILSSDAI